jgi:hypothetical protein
MVRFVVGTGRCGSTLLSKMLAECKPLLSIFEFFNGLDATQRFAPEPCDGRALAAMLSKDEPFVTMVIARGYTVEEIVYPYDSPRSRYRRHDPVPSVVTMTLSHMTDDPDTLFDEVIAFASSLPRQTLSQHYRQLLDWLTQRMGKQLWLERAGSSVIYLEGLHACFPEARFLHIHRDGREAALSMREHAIYRLAVALQYGCGERMDQATEVRATLDQTEAGRQRISELLESRPPVEYFGRYWTEQVIQGYRALRKLNAAQYEGIRFEDLTAKPAETLRFVSKFLELPSEGDDWIARAVQRVHGLPPTRFDKLSLGEQERLDEACRPGMQLLGRGS